MSQWDRIRMEHSSKLIEVLGDRPPIELWKREFDSYEESEEWKDFIYNPLKELANAGVLDDPVQAASGRPWRVASMIVNHHKPLNPRIGMAFATMDPSEGEIGLMIYKVEEAP